MSEVTLIGDGRVPGAELAADQADDRLEAGLRWLPWRLVAGGAIGLIASGVLMHEKLRLLEDPNYIPSCSLNPVLSCGTVMKTDQAEVFGFPNQLIGIGAFSALLAVGLVLLGGAKLAPWCWRGLQVGVLAGLGFVCWLIHQSLYSIGALCPYCMVVWAVVIPLTWWVSLHNLRTGVIPAPRALVVTLTDYQVLVLVVAYLVVIGLALERFWYYWETLLP